MLNVQETRFIPGVDCRDCADMMQQAEAAVSTKTYKALYHKIQIIKPTHLDSGLGPFLGG